MAGERLAQALKRYRQRYQKLTTKGERGKVLDEFCGLTGYHRKYALTLLRRPAEEAVARPRGRGVTYSAGALRVVEAIWRAAGYPWSVRLKALLPQWLPYARNHVRGLTPSVEQEVLRIGARQIDRRLRAKKRQLKRRLYGRTKPGTLLKHHIPVKTDCWDVSGPGSAEIDLVSHSGPGASGEFLYSLNLTDIHSGWCETRAVMGRGEAGVVAALEEMRRVLPFRLQALDSDNGSEFINYHLVDYCRQHDLHFTRGRPYKKNDNAHIEQKNWTQVRKFMGWERYDTEEALQAMNDLYRHELGWMMNFFQPSVKLVHKERVGSRLRRRYDAPQPPLDRLLASSGSSVLPLNLQRPVALRSRLDPFVLAEVMEAKLKRLERIRQGLKPNTKQCVL